VIEKLLFVLKTMVLDVEHRLESTTFITVRDDDFTDYPNISTISCVSNNACDSSTSPRDTLEELRQTHSSILNVTSDAEESDDEDASQQSSIIFADLNEPPQLEEDPFTQCRDEQETPKPVLACCNTGEHSNTFLRGWFDKSTNNIRTATENFTEKFCPVNLSDEPCGNFRKYISSSDKSLQYQMEMDILVILGCTEQPTEEELETWTSPLLCPGSINDKIDKNILQKESITNRVQRIHRLRKDQQIKSPVILKKSKSLDNSMLNETNASSEVSFRDSFGSIFGIEGHTKSIGKYIQPISTKYQHGYDSDPEMDLFSLEGKLDGGIAIDSLNITDITEEISNGCDDIQVINTVQESLNYSWTLTWHPTKDAMNAVGFVKDEKKYFEPFCIQLWFERGHVLHFGHTIVEPQFMWRSLLCRKFTAPYQMRLLNVCRVLPLEDIERSRHPLAMVSHCFVLRMVHGEEFIFEASSERERDLVISRWKLVVARLAMLAVFEDIDSMSREFFTPIADIQTLT